MNTNLGIHSITKGFSNGKIVANDNISTQFSTGQITALTGHNGAGKTTLLNQIMGIIKPDSGSITFDGDSFVQNPSRARNMISMMPQFHAPLVGVTLKQSIEAVLRIKGKSGNELQNQINKVLYDLKIEEWANIPGEKLSGGLQRLTSFAMTIVEPSPILLFDEPTNDVDPVRRKLIWKCLRQLAENRHIVIVVTHNLLEVDQYADRYLLLDHGKVISDSSTDLLKSELLKSSVLNVTVHNLFLDSELPEAKKIVTINDNQEYEIFLDANQVMGAIYWLQKKINNNEIQNYSLTPYSLNSLYGGLTDGKE
ncbi:ABC transporter ATP-binding protein [Dellaglioa sp. L3N]